MPRGLAPRQMTESGLELAEMVVLERVVGRSGSDAPETVVDGESSRRLFKENDSEEAPKASDDQDRKIEDDLAKNKTGQCCVLTFHEGMVRPKSWGGFFLLLLPCLSVPPLRVVVTTCTVPATQTSIQRQCVQDGISSPHKELRDKDHTDMYLGVDSAPGGERTIPVGDVEVVEHCAAGTIIKVWVGDDEAESLNGHFGPQGHERAHWATRIMIHY